MKKIFFSFTTFTLLLVVGCASRELTVSGKKVFLYSQAPKSCEYIGIISNPNVHKSLDLRSSPQETQKDDINFLKNEGGEMGANVIVITSQTKNEAKRYYVRSSKYFIIYEHAINAKAYICPSSIINKSMQDVRLQQHQLIK